MSRAKGSRIEREVASVLEEIGCAVARVGASGAGTDRDLPDLYAGSGGHSVAIEIKSGKRPSNLSQEEAEALHRFAIEMGSEPIVAVRYKGSRALYFAHLGDMPRTDSGNVTISSVPDRFEEHCIAVVTYAETSAGLMVETGRTEFYRGVMA